MKSVDGMWLNPLLLSCVHLSHASKISHHYMRSLAKVAVPRLIEYELGTHMQLLRFSVVLFVIALLCTVFFIAFTLVNRMVNPGSRRISAVSDKLSLYVPKMRIPTKFTQSKGDESTDDETTVASPRSIVEP